MCGTGRDTGMEFNVSFARPSEGKNVVGSCIYM